MRFILNAIEAREYSRFGLRAADARGEASDGIETHRWRAFSAMRKRHFHAVCEARKRDFQMRIFRGEVQEGLGTGSDDGGLQSHNGVAFEAGSIGKIAGHSSRRGRQTRVGIDEQAKCFGFSGHGRLPERRRMLRGNPGNSRDRRCKGERCAGPCRWCSTFRTCNDLPASRIACNWSDFA